MCPKAKRWAVKLKYLVAFLLIIQVMFHSAVLYTSVCHMLTVLCLYIGRSYDHIHVRWVTTNYILMQYVALTRPALSFHVSLIVHAKL